MKTLRIWRGILALTALAFAMGCAPDLVTPTETDDSPTVRSSSATASLGGTVVVKSGNMNGACQTLAAPVVCWSTFPTGWLFYNDENDAGDPTLGSFVSGPGLPLNGIGSAQISVTGSQRRNLATYQFAGTPLSSITALSFRTYNPSAGNGGPASRSAYLHFNVDFNGTDTWQRRLVFVPSQNGTVVQDTWQEWDAINGGNALWSYSATNPGQYWPGSVTPGATLKTWTQIKAEYPGIRIRVTDAFLGMRVGEPYADGYTENIDSFTFGTMAGTTVFDFEPTIQCTVTCYVDAASGNDANGGATAADAKKTIQAAINQVAAGGVVRVLPGTYNEVAPGSAPTSLGGVYQFGLFFGSAKPGITLMGVTAGDVPITSAAATQATINTDATNNFGTSGIFVEAVNTTIQGVTVGPNVSGNNKTIEVVADNFTLQYSATALPNGGAVYISEFDAPAGAVSSYHILNNRFTDGTQIAISSGAGQGGGVANREIKGNIFALGGNTYPSISFNGSGGVPWYTKTVGGAVISGNSFAGGGLQYIRARGTYIEAQFDWQSWWSSNTYDKATVALETESPFAVRSFSYVSGSYTFVNVRRIGSKIQGEIDNAVAADAVLAKAGTYPEDVVVNKANLKLKGAGANQSIILGQMGDAVPTTLEIPALAPNALVDGFTVTRTGNNALDWNGALNNQGVAIYGAGSTLQNSKVTGNRNGVLVYSAGNVTIKNNIIDFNRTGLHLVNSVTGLLVQNNFITNNWTMGVLFRDEGAPNLTGAVTITDNDISGNWYSQVEGRSLFSAPALNVTGNWLGTATPTVFVGPSVDGTSASDEPGYSGQIPVLFGGSAVPPASPPTITYNGLNATNPIGYIPFRCTGVDASAAMGFQPGGALSGPTGSCFDNQGPITTLTPPAPAPINTAISVPVSISDLTTGNSPLKSYTWTRDGGGTTTVNFGTSAVTQSFALAVAADIVADVDNICVKGTDIWGNVGLEVCVLVVWYDPTAGFVTGGGWINSPAGAYEAEPLLTGKANFGFVSKYLRGRTTPTGNTEFQFKAGNLNFSSTSYEWLVVSGAKAQYKGAGTINGAGDFRFMLTVIDGQVSGGGGTDKFRIRIWNNAGGGLVYDNQLSAADTADPTMVIGGGSIVIRR